MEEASTGKVKKSRKRKLNDIVLTGPMADRVKEDGRRRLALNRFEKADLRRQRDIETVVAMYLDIDNDHTFDDMARAIGVSVKTLRQIIKSEEFIDLYNQHFLEVGHDPRLRTAQAALTDMLPVAIRELRNLLTSSSTSPTVKLNVIRDVIRLNNIQPTDPQKGDEKELMDFLKKANLSVNQFNINNPPEEYGRNIEAYLEGDYRDVEQHDTKGNRPMEPEA